MDTPINTPKVENDELVEIQQETPPPIDAIIKVSISKDRLEGYLFIEPPLNDGANPTIETMKSAISDYGISYNVDMDKLKAIDSEPIYNSDILIANGVAPINGEDGTYILKFETEKKNIMRENSEEEVIDYHDLDTVENVKENQVLCIITFPTEGTPGISVKGDELPQKKGKPIQSLLGKNTKLSDNGTVILSKINGQVEFTRNKINVSDVLYIKGDVDYSTGNIKVDNNLVIFGMILPGFEIEAGGNIEVRGMVQSSKVKAGGNITLRSGVTGSELNCNGELNCKYIEGCEIFVKGNINSKNIINSNIKCNKNIQITGSTAKIIGGNYLVEQNIKANTIGSVANVKTKLILGNDIAILDHQQKLLNDISQMESQNLKIEPLITLQKQLEEAGRLTAEKKQMLENANNIYNTNIELLEIVKIELNELEQVLEEKDFGSIVCTGTVYPGTQIVIGIANLFVKKLMNNVSFYYDEGLIRWN